MDMTQHGKWRLLGILDEAGAQLARSEQKLAEADAGIQRMGAIITKVRGLASQMGIEVSDAPQATDAPTHMTMSEFADFMRWGEKRMRSLVKSEMTKGTHYHRNGTTFVIHVAEAQEFIRSESLSVETVSVDELTKFRARRALRNRRSK